MLQSVRAIYENGVLRPLEQLDLQEQQQVRLTVEPAEPVTREESAQAGDPLAGLRVAIGIPDLAEHFDDYRFGRSLP